MSVKVFPKSFTFCFVVDWSTRGVRMLRGTANVGKSAANHSVDVKFGELESTLVHAFFLNPYVACIASGILQF